MNEPALDITPVAEDAAEGRVREVFAEIRAALQVSEVPLFYRVIAHIPLYLETTWRRVRFALFEAGALEVRTKWMVALAISASNNNRPMIVESTQRLRTLGASDEELAELMAVVDVVNGMNKTLKAIGIR